MFHYASHHNVLEKVVMFESEFASQELRNKVKSKDEIINSLVKEVEHAKKTSGPGSSSSSVKDGGGGSGSRKEKESEVQDNLQGAREMRVIMDQMKEENEGLKNKINAKNGTIKNLRDDYADMKKDFREAERKYEQECRYTQTLQNELRLAESSPSHGGGKRSKSEEERKAGGGGGSSHHHRLRARDNEDGVSSSGVTSPKSEDPAGQEATIGEMNRENSGLKVKVETLQDQILAIKSQNEALSQKNDNLKHIIEIGKTTVEAAKKISEDLAEENKFFKEKDLKQISDLQCLEVKLGIVKNESKENIEKLKRFEESLRGKNIELSKFKEENAKKGTEVQKLMADLASTKENLKQEENLKILSDQKREDIKSKLSKCRENCRTVEEAKKTLENDYKVLLQENRNAASEIKTLKNHLNSSRAIVVEKTAVKDDIAKMKSDLTSKTIELEKNNVKVRKLQQQLQESKSQQEQENKTLKEKMRSLKALDGRGESRELESKLKVKEEEIKNLSSKVKGFDDTKKELEERLEFYRQQCSVFEKTDMRHQEEILVLQVSRRNPLFFCTSTVNSF